MNDSIIDDILGSSSNVNILNNTKKDDRSGGGENKPINGGPTNDGINKPNPNDGIVAKPETEVAKTDATVKPKGESIIQKQVRMSDLRAKIKAGMNLYKRGTGKKFPYDPDEIADDDLEDRLNDMRTGIGRGTNHKIINTLLQQTPVAYVYVCKYMGINMNEFLNISKKDKEFHDICDELAWEYSSYSYQRPELKMLMYFVKTTFLVQQQNAAVSGVSKEEIDDVSKDINDQYNDL